jgi:hypothetical protein
MEPSNLIESSIQTAYQFRPLCDVNWMTTYYTSNTKLAVSSILGADQIKWIQVLVIFPP